jgi:hypothetical protein
MSRLLFSLLLGLVLLGCAHSATPQERGEIIPVLQDYEAKRPGRSDPAAATMPVTPTWADMGKAYCQGAKISVSDTDAQADYDVCVPMAQMAWPIRVELSKATGTWVVVSERRHDSLFVQVFGRRK